MNIKKTVKKYLWKLFPVKLDDVERIANAKKNDILEAVSKTAEAEKNDILKAVSKTAEAEKKDILKAVSKTAEAERRRMLKTMPRPLLQYEVQLVEHCNLNCAYCDHFSPLAKPEFLNVEDYRKDVTRLSELFQGEMRDIHLMGGEPLLHPQVEDFIRVTREAFPVGTIQLVTNGLLLPKMPESFWETCKRYDTMVSATHYPVRFDYEACEELAKSHGVRYRCYHDLDKSKMHKHILDGNDIFSDARANFLNCNSANACIFLQKGRMYTCPVAATAHHFCEHFDVDLHASPFDSIDIYQAKSGKEIMEFVSHPIPFCRYCNKKAQMENLEWHVSEKDIHECVNSQSNFHSSKDVEITLRNRGF